MQNRAKIFMPFDALDGFKRALKREEELHEKRYYEEENICQKVRKLNIGENIGIVYYNNFEVITSYGQIKKIDFKNNFLQLSNSIIYFDNIDEIKKRL